MVDGADLGDAVAVGRRREVRGGGRGRGRRVRALQNLVMVFTGKLN